MAALVVEITATEDYRVWELKCPACSGESWYETTHELYNVVAITCIWCDQMLMVLRQDMHGDDNKSEDEEGWDE